jgi:hypothetical protein
MQENYINFKFLGYKFEYNLLVKLDIFVNFYWH